jgi:hypothetical protein
MQQNEQPLWSTAAMVDMINLGGKFDSSEVNGHLSVSDPFNMSGPAKNDGF